LSSIYVPPDSLGVKKWEDMTPSSYGCAAPRERSWKGGDEKGEREGSVGRRNVCFISFGG